MATIPSRTLLRYWWRLNCNLLFVTFSWLRNATESMSFDFDLTKMLNCRHKKLNKRVLFTVIAMFGSCMHSHMQRWPIIDCSCTSQNYKEPFRFMLGTQVLIGRHIWSRSLAWLYYGPNFVGFFSDFCQSGTNVSLLSRSLIVQFLSLLSAWLSSRSVSLLSETIFLASILPMSRSEFLYGIFSMTCKK